MDADRVAALREALRHTDWWSQALDLGRAVRRTPGPGHLLLVGTPRVEPWHLAAHLDDEARFAAAPQLAPQLVRWQPPPQAPEHLRIGLTRLERVARGETVLVVAPDAATDALLERVDDARHAGATVLALDSGDAALGALAHEQMSVTASGLSIPHGWTQLEDADTSGLVEPRDDDPGGLPADVVAGLNLPAGFDLAQHFVSAAAGQPGLDSRPGWRTRLARLLDAVSGPATGSPTRR